MIWLVQRLLTGDPEGIMLQPLAYISWQLSVACPGQVAGRQKDVEVNFLFLSGQTYGVSDILVACVGFEGNRRR